MKTTTARIEDAVLERADGLAKVLSRSVSWVINPAIAGLLEYEEWFMKEIEDGHGRGCRTWIISLPIIRLRRLKRLNAYGTVLHVWPISPRWDGRAGYPRARSTRFAVPSPLYGKVWSGNHPASAAYFNEMAEKALILGLIFH